MKDIVDIGSRVEMFIDRTLIEGMHNTALKLNTPIKKEIVLKSDKPWEGPESCYYTLFQDEGRVRVYYRGYSTDNDTNPEQIACYAESKDGINFVKPALNIYDYNGMDNNIVWRGIEAHNFTPFKDDRPEVSEEDRYKAVGGATPPGQKNGNLYALVSNDGYVWKKLYDTPILNNGTFDSQNIVFWDSNIKKYRCYSRYFSNGGFNGVRAIQSCISEDFTNWSSMKKNKYANSVPMEHFYTNATLTCPGAEHIYLSFPKRFIPDRKKVLEHSSKGVSDAVFMTSRDGINWDRTFMEAWCRPGYDNKNWVDRNNMVSWGIIETSPTEFSMYISEHYHYNDNRLRRISIRKHGFASVNAGYCEGVFTTKPLTFDGESLLLNYSTSGVGHIRVQISDITGNAIKGFSFDDMEPLYGDNVYEAVHWKEERKLMKFYDRPVRLSFQMKDADLYSLRFGKQ